MSAREASLPARRGGAARRGEAGFGPRFVIAVSAGSVLNPVNSSIIAVALVSIGHAFGAGPATTVWLVSGLYLATAVGQPAMGRLADRLGPRRIYLAGTALVAAGGLLGTWGSSLGLLVAARVILGIGTSAAYPAGMAMIRRQSQRLQVETPGSVLGALAVAGQATMAIGPPLGGLLIALGGWRLTFLINLPLAFVAAILALAWLPRDEPRDHGAAAWKSLDPLGAGLFAAGLTGLLLFLMHRQAPAWWLAGLAALLLAALAWRETRTASPFIDVRMLAHNRALTTTYLRYGVTMLVTYCFVYGWALWLEQSAGKSAALTGMLIMPSFIVAAAVSAAASRRRQVWWPLTAGGVALAAVSVSLLVLSHGAPLWELIAVSLLFGVQNGLNVVANQAAMYAQAPAADTGTAAGLLRTFMYLGAICSAALLAAAFGTRVDDTGLHHLALIMTAASAAVLAATVLDRQLHPRRTRRQPRQA